VSADDLLHLLRVIADSTDRSPQLDSSDVSRTLGWSDAVTASSLAEARARLLIWGMRVGGTPAPRFEDIELTVQGRRLLLAADRMPAGEPSVIGDAVSTSSTTP
jgi:hypothetical protein